MFATGTANPQFIQKKYMYHEALSRNCLLPFLSSETGFILKQEVKWGHSATQLEEATLNSVALCPLKGQLCQDVLLLVRSINPHAKIHQSWSLRKILTK